MPEALRHSWEQLELMAAAHKRLRAREMLKLAQLIIAGQGDAAGWKNKQTELISETEIKDG